MPSMQVRISKAGDGFNTPVEGQSVRVHYVGKLQDGTIFDSSRKRDRSFEFKVGENQVIAGWEQLITQMSLGQVSVAVIPPELAYGPHGYPPIIPPNATLTFEVELLAISPPTT